MLCTLCDFDNVEGADVCDGCGHSLTSTPLAPPRTKIERNLLKDRIASLAPKTPITVSPQTTVGEVLKLMDSKEIGCVIVAEQGRAVGIFSERDALLKINTDAPTLANRPISEFMTPNPQTLVSTAKIAFAVHRMDQGSFRHVPIVSAEGELTGIISVRDILKYLTDRMVGDDR